ncbi:DUF362 domain-containing protein [Methanoculleus chikugoensis]|uniref:DUF362 domain-containing protein n=1 Tax=Methanoculleus chikugoensis TaxID=118126 RepID=UPI001FB332C4|nr:DUF362 domain-containing protein [Methanoculleus chikugoensis]
MRRLHAVLPDGRDRVRLDDGDPPVHRAALRVRPRRRPRQTRKGRLHQLPPQHHPDCDCVSWSDAAVVPPDIGILASTDPVAIDRASFDLVNSEQGFSRTLLAGNFAPGEDKFKGIWDYTDGRYQFAYAAGIGLGEETYRLIEV